MRIPARNAAKIFVDPRGENSNQLSRRRRETKSIAQPYKPLKQPAINLFRKNDFIYEIYEVRIYIYRRHSISVPKFYRIKGNFNTSSAH